MADGALGLSDDERQYVQFDPGRFSPDGKFLAFMIGDIPVRDRVQVWLYDIRSQRLIPVLKLGPALQGIDGLAWGGDGTLYVKALGIHGLPVFFGATIAAGRVPEMNETDRRPTDLVFEPNSHSWRQERNCCYVVTAANRGHGDIWLWVGPTNGGPQKLIVRGGWGLFSFLFDKDHSQVVYPGVEGIVSVDLRTLRRRVLLRLGDVDDLELMDRTRDGTSIAYSVFAPCLGNAGRVPAGQQRQRQRLCFFKPD